MRNLCRKTEGYRLTAPIHCDQQDRKSSLLQGLNQTSGPVADPIQMVQLRPNEDTRTRERKCRYLDEQQATVNHSRNKKSLILITKKLANDGFY